MISCALVLIEEEELLEGELDCLELVDPSLVFHSSSYGGIKSRP